MLEAVSLRDGAAHRRLRVSHERCEQEFREQEFAKLASQAQLSRSGADQPHFCLMR
jgi:hypothetical protein